MPSKSALDLPNNKIYIKIINKKIEKEGEILHFQNILSLDYAKNLAMFLGC